MNPARRPRAAEPTRRGSSSSKDGALTGLGSRFGGDGREQMTHPDGGGTVIAFSVSQRRHAGSNSSAAPSSWPDSAITLSAAPPSEPSVIRRVSTAAARSIAFTFRVFQFALGLWC